MKITKTLIITAAALLCVSASVDADTIDFESLMQENTGINVVGDTFESNGFVIDGVGLGNVGTLDSRFSGSTSLTSDANSVIALSRIGGGPFALESVDLAELDMSAGIPVVTFIGFLSSGGTTAQSVELDGQMNSPETVSFDSSFSNIVGVVWVQGGTASSRHQFDNLQLSAIPEPTTAALLYIAFVAAAARRRR